MRPIDFPPDIRAQGVDLKQNPVCLKEQGEDFALEELGQQAVMELSEMMRRPLKVFASLGYQEVDMRVEIN
jgi:hypothetical protein